MNPEFVYSFDRESWTGSYGSRKQAAEAGMAAAARHPDSIGSIYVGQKVVPNPRAFGHARQVLDNMIRRVRDDAGDSADDFLRSVTDQQVIELDGKLEQTVVQWLDANDLTPKFYHVEAISEHSVPLGRFVADEAPTQSEVYELGESRYPANAVKMS
jgi:hypothetical protein